MTAAELDRFVREKLSDLETFRPGAARPGRRWNEARAEFTAAVADKTGVDAALVAELLDRREVIRRTGHTSCAEQHREAADTAFVTAVMAAAAVTAAAGKPRPGRR